FGRIGRAFFRLAHKHEGIEIVAINDLADPENLAYLLQKDSVYGKYPLSVEAKEGELLVGGESIPLCAEPDPAKLPWKKYDVDIVIEATGVFASYEKSKAHLDAGAKRVLVSAPVKDIPPQGIEGNTVLMGVNERALKDSNISSNASCTTNAGSPLAAILNEGLGIEKALLSTVHGYTASQSLVDSPNKKDFCRGRAAGVNIVPTTTGAATATTKAVTSLEGKFDGIAIRVPVAVGSLVDVTFISKRETTVEEVNDIMRKAAKEDRWKGIFRVTEEPLVSTDIIGDLHGSIADLYFTRVVGGNLVKVLAWYDNEMGYANTLLLHAIESGKYV
ncbi:MAG: glyceraldehyde 3-phosphate dehydrogenase NAD-binding domain-containing protein, partial [Candidatus Paceibacterota bacterium]